MAPDTPPETTKAVIGRPTLYSDELAASICERLENGTTLLNICRDADMPCKTTVYRWLSKNTTFKDSFQRARHNQMHTWADECVGIADDGTTDYITKTGRNGVEYEALDQEHVQRSKLRVDTRLRIMAVVAPHAYGQIVDHKHSGVVDHVHSLSGRERMRRMALFLLEDDAAGGALIDGVAIEVQPETEQASAAACELCGQYHVGSACPVIEGECSNTETHASSDVQPETEQASPAKPIEP